MGWYMGRRGLRGWCAALWLNIHDALLLAWMTPRGWRVGPGKVDQYGELVDVEYCLRHPSLPGIVFVPDHDGWVVTHELSGLSLCCFIDHYDWPAFKRAVKALRKIDWTRGAKAYATDDAAADVVYALRKWLNERRREETD